MCLCHSLGRLSLALSGALPVLYLLWDRIRPFFAALFPRYFLPPSLPPRPLLLLFVRACARACARARVRARARCCPTVSHCLCRCLSYFPPLPEEPEVDLAEQAKLLGALKPEALQVLRKGSGGGMEDVTEEEDWDKHLKMTEEIGMPLVVDFGGKFCKPCKVCVCVRACVRACVRVCVSHFLTQHNTDASS